MNSRARQLAAIRHEVPDRIPLDCIHVEIQGQLAGILGIPQEQVLPALGIDGRLVAVAYAGEMPSGPDEALVNEWGSPHTQEYGTSGPYPLASASTVAEIAAYPWPDPERYDYAAAASEARQWGSEYAVRGPYWLPLFDRACELLGMEEAMICMRATPVLFEALLDEVFQRTATICRRLLEACGDAMPILCLGDDFATQRGLMISPDDWRRLLKPRYAALFALGKRLSKVVWFHSCGDITAVLPDLIDIGMDVWETVQLHTLPISAERLKREYGEHITFFGGVNTQRLPFITPEAVRVEVRRCIEAFGRNGGYICGPDHHIKPDVPAQNALALFEAARTYRGRGYTLLSE
ncbi:MAG: uroporphyrinogen decarboxylase family protein [Anaerolineae bacterium]